MLFSEVANLYLKFTVENVTEYLFDKIDGILRRSGAELLRIEVSDSPTRSYCIDATGRTLP